MHLELDEEVNNRFVMDEKGEYVVKSWWLTRKLE